MAGAETVESSQYSMRDPTAELSPVMRERLTPPDNLQGCTIGLLSIAKERSAEYLDSVEAQLADHLSDVTIKRFEKPTHTKPAPEAVLQQIVESCDVVVVGLAD
jgi:hypothetical protein